MLVQPFRTAQYRQFPPTLAVDRKVAVLLNAHARKVTPKVIRALSHAVPEGDLFVSRSELDARRIAQQVVERGYHTVFLGGGDGTVMCFVNEIFHQVALGKRRGGHAQLPRFGVLKLGTGNSVASWVKASNPSGNAMVDDVLRARSGEASTYRSIDLLMVDGKRAPFAGVGVDGQVLNDYLWVKNTLGQGAFNRVMTGPGGYFTSVALKTVPYYLTHSAAVECEVVNGRGLAYRMGPNGMPQGAAIQPGETLFRGPVKLAAAGTVPYYGYELKMFPFAGRRRGSMNVRLGTVPATSVLANLGRLWNGTWFPDGIKDYVAQEVFMRFEEPMPLQVGGDAEGHRTELHLEVSHEPIDVLDLSRSSARAEGSALLA